MRWASNSSANAALSKRIQAHFTANGVQTVKEGTDFITVLDEEGKPKEQHTGTRAIVEVGFHSLRHTFVNLCRAAGAPLSVVEAIVGHASPAMTRHYTHVGEDAARVSVILMSSILGEAMELPALPALAADAAAEGNAEGEAGDRTAVPAWIRTALSVKLAALDAGQNEKARREGASPFH